MFTLNIFDDKLFIISFFIICFIIFIINKVSSILIKRRIIINSRYSFEDNNHKLLIKNDIDVFNYKYKKLEIDFIKGSKIYYLDFKLILIFNYITFILFCINKEIYKTYEILSFIYIIFFFFLLIIKIMNKILIKKIKSFICTYINIFFTNLGSLRKDMNNDLIILNRIRKDETLIENIIKTINNNYMTFKDIKEFEIFLKNYFKDNHLDFLNDYIDEKISGIIYGHIFGLVDINENIKLINNLNFNYNCDLNSDIVKRFLNNAIMIPMKETLYVSSPLYYFIFILINIAFSFLLLIPSIIFSIFIFNIFKLAPVPSNIDYISVISYIFLYLNFTNIESFIVNLNRNYLSEVQKIYAKSYYIVLDININYLEYKKFLNKKSLKFIKRLSKKYM